MRNILNNIKKFYGFSKSSEIQFVKISMLIFMFLVFMVNGNILFDIFQKTYGENIANYIIYSSLLIYLIIYHIFLIICHRKEKYIKNQQN